MTREETVNRLMAQARGPEAPLREVLTRYVRTHLPQRMTWRSEQVAYQALEVTISLEKEDLEDRSCQLGLEMIVLRIREAYDVQLQIPPLDARTVASLMRDVTAAYKSAEQVLVERFGSSPLTAEKVRRVVEEERTTVAELVDSPESRAALRRPAGPERIRSLVDAWKGNLGPIVETHLAKVRAVSEGANPEQIKEMKQEDLFMVGMSLGHLGKLLFHATMDPGLKLQESHAVDEIDRIDEEMEKAEEEAFRKEQEQQARLSPPPIHPRPRPGVRPSSSGEGIEARSPESGATGLSEGSGQLRQQPKEGPSGGGRAGSLSTSPATGFGKGGGRTGASGSDATNRRLWVSTLIALGGAMAIAVLWYWRSATRHV